MEFIIEEPDKKIGQEIKANWDRLAKPLDGLGEFEGLLARIGAILGSPEIDIAKKAVIVMCADNGIVAEDVYKRQLHKLIKNRKCRNVKK